MERKHVNVLTINTDASFYKDYGVGAYAFHIVCDLFKIQKAGAFKQSATDSTECEMKCIANAISTLLAQKELPTVKWLIINTDSKHGIKRIKNPVTDFDKQVAALWNKLIQRMDSRKNKLRWVPAHTGVNDKRSLANEWCDQQAKKYARLEINRIKLQNP